MKQFDLKEYLANPSRKVVTRDGCPVRILCTDRKSYNVEIVGLIMSDTGMEYICTWTQQGKKYLNRDTPDDLFFAPEKHEGWINIYRNDDEDYYKGKIIYSSKEDAIKRGEKTPYYITTTKIEWEEQL